MYAMGFLHKIWDETVAGPAPETGLGKLRKYNSFSGGTGTGRSPVTVDVPISRSITIVRTQSGFKNSATSEPASPSSVPITPRTPTPESPGGHFKKFTRKKPSSSPETVDSSEQRSPANYNWVIVSALDRF